MVVVEGRYVWGLVNGALERKRGAGAMDKYWLLSESFVSKLALAEFTTMECLCIELE
jgi:hypothetical protein